MPVLLCGVLSGSKMDPQSVKIKIIMTYFKMFWIVQFTISFSKSSQFTWFSFKALETWFIK